MKIINLLKERVTRLLSAPAGELGTWARFVRVQIRLWGFCMKRLRQCNVSAMSAALSFRTLFAFVPILLLTILILKSFEIVDNSKVLLRRFMRESGLIEISYNEEPASRPAEESSAEKPLDESKAARAKLMGQIESFVENAERQLNARTLGPVGVVLLIWTALTLLRTLEGSLNRIFEAPRGRSTARSIVSYWSMMTLGPLLLFVASFLFRKASVSVETIPILSGVVGFIGWIVPVIVGILLVAALYTLMPNTYVRYRDALGGAVVAVPMWLIARWAFSLYMGSVGTKSIYGAMAIAPLFLFWLNLSWWIILFGAELVYTAANYSRIKRFERVEEQTAGPWDIVASAAVIARAYLKEEGPATLDHISLAINLVPQSTEKLLELLVANGIAYRISYGQERAYMLAKPAARITVAEILQSVSKDEKRGEGGYGGTVATAVATVQSRSEESTAGLTLADLLAEE